MKLTKENIYKLIAGSVGVSPTDLSIKANMFDTYHLDSLGLFDLALVIEEYTGFFPDLPDNIVTEVNTAEQFADYILDLKNQEV